MTLTDRLGTSLESALDSYCAVRGVTKSLVVQESLAACLLDAASAKAPAPPAWGQTEPGSPSAPTTRPLPMPA